MNDNTKIIGASWSYEITFSWYVVHLTYLGECECVNGCVEQCKTLDQSFQIYNKWVKVYKFQKLQIGWK
jgi:hypothetical protein